MSTDSTDELRSSANQVTPDDADALPSVPNFETDTSTTNSDDSVYTEASSGIDTERADSTDEVDIRKLVRDPSLDDIRWVTNHTIGGVLVKKPVKDAFKNGFTIENDPTSKVTQLLNEVKFVDKYKLTQIKARRDGFALLYVQYTETDGDPATEPTRDSVRGVDSVKVWSIDDLSDSAPPETYEHLERMGYDRQDVEIRHSGMVISRKMGDTEFGFGNPVGYIREFETERGRQRRFIHADRVMHFTWNEDVDIDFKGTNDRGERSLGRWEGNSVIMPAYHYLKDSFKGSWAVMQTIFRYSSPLYELSLPQRINDPDEVSEIRNEWQNLNAKAEAVLPPDFELNLHSTEGQLQPAEYFDVIFDEICAATEMTRSVLFGTQSGTVSGSETDVKNYFNQVHRMRQNRFEDDIDAFVRMVFRLSPSTVPSFALGYKLEWEPLFQLNEQDAEEVRVREMQRLKSMLDSFAIEPDEIREYAREHWDMDLDELTDEEIEFLKSLNHAQVGAPFEGEGESSEGNPRVGNQNREGEGAMEQGQQTASEQPDTDSTHRFNW